MTLSVLGSGLNWAAVFSLPVLFVCEDNEWSATTRTSEMTAGAGAADRARALGLHTVGVDGNDAEAVADTAAALVAQVRETRKPAFLHARTYRQGGHTYFDPATYRPAGEADARTASDDPIARQREALANYEQAVLRAFADSESAIAGYSAANQAVLAVREAQKLAAEAESLAARLYREGLVDYLALLDAQRQLATVDDALAAAEGEVLLAATRLYKALGGDWDSAGS